LVERNLPDEPNQPDKQNKPDKPDWLLAKSPNQNVQ
jgi:hypothetical protein